MVGQFLFRVRETQRVALKELESTDTCGQHKEWLLRKATNNGARTNFSFYHILTPIHRFVIYRKLKLCVSNAKVELRKVKYTKIPHWNSFAVRIIYLSVYKILFICENIISFWEFHFYMNNNKFLLKLCIIWWANFIYNTLNLNTSLVRFVNIYLI